MCPGFFSEGWGGRIFTDYARHAALLQANMEMWVTMWLRNDKEVAIAASCAEEDAVLAIEYFGNELMADRGFIISILKKHGCSTLPLLGDDYKEDDNLLTKYIEFQVDNYGGGDESFDEAVEGDEFNAFDMQRVRKLYKTLSGKPNF